MDVFVGGVSDGLFGLVSVLMDVEVDVYVV